MRLWSLHPRYLDPKGLVALWREGLLAQAVLAGQTRGYRQHPQLLRFQQCAQPCSQIANYLLVIHDHAALRGYRFDRSKIGCLAECGHIPVTTGQLDYEWAHLRAKLETRAPDWLASLGTVYMPAPHPLFAVMPGEVERWELVAAGPAVKPVGRRN